jgi:hypothetical protein
MGPATARQATGWVTVRRPTCSVMSAAVGDGFGVVAAVGVGVVVGVEAGVVVGVEAGDATGVETGLGAGVGTGELLHAATAITAATRATR